MRSVIATLILAMLVLNIVACSPISPTPSGNGNNAGTQGTSGVNSVGTYSPTPPPNFELEAKTFKNNDELLSFIKSHQGGSYGNYGGGVMMRGVALDAAVPTAAMEKGASAGSAGNAAPTPSPDHSTTNNQVASVDEADIIKTDGNYIYTVTGTTLFIVKAYPGEDAKVVKKITLKSQPTGLFIDGNKLAVMGNFYDAEYFKTIDFIPRNGMTYVNIYDVTSKEDPKLEKEYKFEGNYQDARLYNNDLYLIVQSNPIYRPEHPTPIYMEGTTIKQTAASSIRYFPLPYQNMQYTTVHSIDLAKSELVDSASVLTDYTQTVYMSEKNLYLVSNLYINEWQIQQEVTKDLLEGKLTKSEQDVVDKIKATDDLVLSQQEKQSKIFQVYSEHIQYKMSEKEQQAFQDDVQNKTKERMDEYDALQYSVINRAALDNGKITFEANGKVPGSLVNQFSLDEHNNVLRVATTLRENRWWREEPMPLAEDSNAGVASDSGIVAKRAIMPPRPWVQNTKNSVYTLDMGLNVLGKLEDLAPGESIQSTRFIGDRLYMVTFKQVDPFFVIDLSNPKKISNLGTLKVPGFSRYLHPYDDNTVIGIGQDATNAGRQTGLKIGLFDVSDVSAPKEVAKFKAEGDYSSSTAEWEHKAFLFSREKELLVIPAYSYEYNNGYGTSHQNYNGAMVFHISTSDISLRGIVDHSSGQQQWSPAVERSLWIGDDLYTKSPNLLRINALSDLHSIANVSLSEQNTGNNVYKTY